MFLQDISLGKSGLYRVLSEDVRKMSDSNTILENNTKHSRQQLLQLLQFFIIILTSF